MMLEAVDMYTVFDYLYWRGDLTLKDSPFNEVDAAILARFSYEPFDGIVTDSLRNWVTVKDACALMLNSPTLNEDVLDAERDTEFIRKIGDSKRFGSMKISGYINDTDIERQIQFSACVFDIDGEQNYYVAYRGTDNNIIAWKEDFNMGFEFPVPAQTRALEYFESVVSTFKDGTFMVGGHSKGGNLAVYAATFCDDKYNVPVTDIYNFDGPGFKENIMEMPEFKRIEDSIHTYVPEFSVVGMLLEHLERYSVVHSFENGIMEHEVLSWETGPLAFIHKEERSAGSKIFDQTFKDWISGLDKDQREQFVDTVFGLLMCDDAKKLAEFKINRRETLNAMIETYKNMDEQNKTGFKAAAKRLFETAGKMLKANTDKPKLPL